MSRPGERRAPAVLGRRAFVGFLCSSAVAPALGRIPATGTLRLRVPWPTAELDPHDPNDVTAAFFGRAVFDPLFAIDDSGRPYPALARELPERVPEGARVTLRAGLVTAQGRALRVEDAVWSLQRARRLGARALLGAFGEPAVDRRNPGAFIVPGAAPEELATALASPLTSLIPRTASPGRPDGTGAFAATPSPARLTLVRNPRAARGASFLERVEITPAPISDALRAFEAFESDVGWLGAGLHRSRKGAKTFTSAPAAYVVLRTGSEAGAWGAPGVAQKLLDGIPPGRLSHFGLERPGATAAPATWGGPSARLLVRDDAPFLLDVARAIAAILTAPGHDVTVVPTPNGELRRLRASGRFALFIDVVRHLGPTPRDALLSLLSAADPALARRPPDLGSMTAERLTRTLPLGVVGELRAMGSCDESIHGLDEFNLADAWRKA